MKALFDYGEIYMNTLEFYRNLEDHDERKDVNEGVVRVQNHRGGILKLKNSATGTFEEVAQLTHTRIRERNSTIQNLHVYCLYYFKAEMPIKSLGTLIAKRTQHGFGDYAVLVVDAAEFVTRVKKAAIDKGYHHYRSLVKYVDFSQEEIDVGPFVKDQVYS